MTQLAPLCRGAATRRTTLSKAESLCTAGSDQLRHEACRNAMGRSRMTSASTYSRTRRGGWNANEPTLLQRDLAEEAQLVERAPRAQHDRELRVLRDHDRQAGLLAQEHVEVLQLRAAAREHD